MDDPEKSLDEWLNDVKAKKPDAIDYSFPSDKLRDEYIAGVAQRSDRDVIDLIRKFLIPSGSLGSDQFTFSWLAHLAKKGELKRLTEFQRRLIFYAKAMVRGALPKLQTPPPWEGITWVLDLLPDNPRGAIDTLNAYFEAHCLFMPDGRMHGIADATELIRLRFIQTPRSNAEAIRLLLDESPRTFEYLIERLYSKMGYSTQLTPRQKDGGFDVLAVREERGRRAKIHIECKKWEGNVGEPIIRGLLGVVSDSKATNGVCVTTSNLTEAAKKFVARNPQLDFIPGETLIPLLNEYFGPSWFYRIERLVQESKGRMDIES